MNRFHLSKFQLILLRDVCLFSFFWACALSPRALAVLVAGFLMTMAKHADARIQRVPEPLTRGQRRAQAAVTIGGFSSFGIVLLVATIHENTPRAWCIVAGVFFPVIAVFCYWAVRIELGLEPLMEAARPANQATERTANRPVSTLSDG